MMIFRSEVSSMNWTIATNNQLETIVNHDKDLPPSLLRGLVNEMLNRGMFDKILAKVMYTTVNPEQLDKLFGIGEDDLLQIGRIEVIKAIETFDGTRGKSFISFVYQNVKCEFLNQVTILYAAKRDCSRTISYNKESAAGVTLEYFLPDKNQNVERYVINKITVESLMEHLNEKEMKMIEYRMNGYTYPEIGEVFGKNYRTIHRSIKEAYKKMRIGA
jgi:RNA polymerase sigma factor (sigma-70 family)